jgi:hypothetical protein
MPYRIRAHNGSKLERLVHYRNRAEMVRIVAEDFTHDATRETLLDVANAYDKLAEDTQRDF